VKFQIWSIIFCDAETWELRKIDRKYLRSVDLWCWRRMERVSGLFVWTVEKYDKDSRRKGTSYVCTIK
jgi:hypothetical protein